MKRIVTLAAGLFLSLSLAAAASAAQKGTPPVKTSPGLQNSKKVVQAKVERSKKQVEVHKRAYAKRQQAQGN